MKNNYHIRRNAEEPSPERIAAHQDFDALLAQHRAAAPGRSGTLRLLYVALSAAAAVLVGWLVFRPAAVPYPVYEQVYFAEKPYVHPPLPALRPQFTAQRVVVSDGGVLEYPSGSRLVIPRAAFADDRGALVTGEVDVHFRELADYTDIFRSGIPMTYDSAGVRYTLLSAGMLEVFAEQDGRRVRLAPGKALDVALVSQITAPAAARPPHYNVYRLDTAARNWVYAAPTANTAFADAPKENQAPAYPVARLLAEWQATHPAPVAPVRPARGRAGEPVFELDLAALLSDQSDLSLLQNFPANTLWQMASGSTATPQDLGRRAWPDARIAQLDARTYRLTLIAPDETLPVRIQPVLQGAAFAAALEAFERAEADYLLAKQGYDRERAAYERQLQAEARRRAQLANPEGHAHDHGPTRRRVISRFQATELGIWNADRPVPPAPHTLTVSFQNAQGKTYLDRPVFLADKRRNTLHRFVATEATELRFDLHGRHQLWLLTEDNRIAVLPPFSFPTEDGPVVLQDPVAVNSREALHALLE